MALLLLGGCNTARNLPDVQLPDFFTQASPPAAPAPRSPVAAPSVPAGTPGSPAYVMLATPNGDNSAPVAKVHMNLPTPAEMPAAAPSPLGPVVNSGASRMETVNQPFMSVLNSTATQPPPPMPPEGSTPILASIQDLPAGETIDRDLHGGRPGSRPPFGDVPSDASGAPDLRVASSAPALSSAMTDAAGPAGYEVATAFQEPVVGAALTGIVEDDTPAAPGLSTPPPITKLFADPEPSPARPTVTDVRPALPQQATGPEVRLVNSKRLSLNYEIRDGSAAGPTEVELWCTHDGRNWKKKEPAPLGKPPCLVDVDDEDLYGFTLRAHRAGSAGKPPPEGDRPQVWVEVDVTKPTVWLLDVECGQGAEGRQATIMWKAGDKNLAPRPITLSYAAGPEGPWMPFASQLENTGWYLWQIPRDVPPHFLVRVKAIDQAGNVGMAQTAQALGEDPSQPTAAILKVEATQK
jgi:hypothetical protein